MDGKEREIEKKISIAELENEELDRELSKAQKKAAIREAKQMYGSDWRKTLWGAAKSLRLNKDTLHSLHGLGMDSSLRDLNDPSKFKPGRRGR